LLLDHIIKIKMMTCRPKPVIAFVDDDKDSDDTVVVVVVVVGSRCPCCSSDIVLFCGFNTRLHLDFRFRWAGKDT